MAPSDVLTFAWRALSRHALRTALSLVGVAVGVTAVVPMSATSRLRSPWETVSVPAAIGDTSRAEAMRSPIASASARVRSLGAPPMPGIPPVVSTFPGTTIRRFEPIEANWSTT